MVYETKLRIKSLRFTINGLLLSVTQLSTAINYFCLQADHEVQRRQDAELVKMQEESSARKEQARRATEEQIQAQLRRTERERAELERETLRVKAMAEAEARSHEAKLTEEQNRRLLLEQIKGEREKWISAINATFSHIEGINLVLINIFIMTHTKGEINDLCHFDIFIISKGRLMDCITCPWIFSDIHHLDLLRRFRLFY